MPLLQIFEHEVIRVGDARDGVVFRPTHFDALAAWSTRMDGRYFTILHQAVRFHQYVGVLQAGDLTIEILPKADREAGPATGKWQAVLLDLLRECRLLPQYALPPVGQGLRRHALLDLYIDYFLEEMTGLLRQGLLRAYRRVSGNLPVLRGRLHAERQIRINAARIERFYTERDQFDYRHPFNGLLWGALETLRRLPLTTGQQSRLEQCRLRFPAGVDAPSSIPAWEAFIFSRRTEPYRPALQLAWLLLRHYRPSLRAGQFPTIALLFDMNRLFEEYVYRQLLSAKAPGDRLLRQARRPFWSGSHLRPDIVLQRPAGNIVFDTKWKALGQTRPAIADLQQLFAYLHYFHAGEGALVYPQIYGMADSVEPFHPLRQGEAALRAHLLFAEVVDAEGQLNRALGADLLARLAPG